MMERNICQNTASFLLHEDLLSIILGIAHGSIIWNNSKIINPGRVKRLNIISNCDGDFFAEEILGTNKY